MQALGQSLSAANTAEGKCPCATGTNVVQCDTHSYTANI
jgi:hypothetical protein